MWWIWEINGCSRLPPLPQPTGPEGQNTRSCAREEKTGERWSPSTAERGHEAPGQPRKILIGTLSWHCPDYEARSRPRPAHADTPVRHLCGSVRLDISMSSPFSIAHTGQMQTLRLGNMTTSTQMPREVFLCAVRSPSVLKKPWINRGRFLSRNPW